MKEIAKIALLLFHFKILHTCIFISCLKTHTCTQNQNGPSLSPSLVYTYDNALDGFSAYLSPSELKALEKLPEFILACKDAILVLDTTHTPEFIFLNNSFGLWPSSNFGQNTIIGIVDSGIWPENLSFQDHGMPKEVPISKWNGSCAGGEDFNSSFCNSKLIGVRYFNEGLKRVRNETMPKIVDSARDILGHGTQVSSIAAGKYVEEAFYFGYAEGVGKGVAPQARLAVYNAFWTEGRDSDLLSAMNQAIADGLMYFLSPRNQDHQRNYLKTRV
ncbi:Peptidase S8, subtilisin-related [Parasponia andersonii]|uniref:Peptidase S8, subtilisin-related n=1 Tax=Parasponia andersonii TaxID=3476 RepID=A0A2P5ASQ5_PARAD|nr:Peptidase S8, subtilisin-related [Parasponia andersonii]